MFVRGILNAYLQSITGNNLQYNRYLMKLNPDFMVIALRAIPMIKDISIKLAVYLWYNYSI